MRVPTVARVRRHCNHLNLFARPPSGRRRRRRAFGGGAPHAGALQPAARVGASARQRRGAADRLARAPRERAISANSFGGARGGSKRPGLGFGAPVCRGQFSERRARCSRRTRARTRARTCAVVGVVVKIWRSHATLLARPARDSRLRFACSTGTSGACPISVGEFDRLRAPSEPAAGRGSTRGVSPLLRSAILTRWQALLTWSVVKSLAAVATPGRSCPREV